MTGISLLIKYIYYSINVSVQHAKRDYMWSVARQLAKSELESVFGIHWKADFLLFLEDAHRKSIAMQECWYCQIHSQSSSDSFNFAHSTSQLKILSFLDDCK